MTPANPLVGDYSSEPKKAPYHDDWWKSPPLGASATKQMSASDVNKTVTPTIKSGKVKSSVEGK